MANDVQVNVTLDELSITSTFEDIHVDVSVDDGPNIGVSFDEVAVEVQMAGPTGPQGAPGTPGAPGKDGAGTDKTYSQSFLLATSLTVTHNLGKYPAVTVIDSAGDECVGDIDHLSMNSFVISFSAQFSGVVICN